MSRKYDHIHKYIRITGKPVFRCTISGCPHIINGPDEIMLGKIAKCPYCEINFEITYEHLRRKIIHCLNCTKHGKPIEKEKETLTDPFADLIKEKLG